MTDKDTDSADTTDLADLADSTDSTDSTDSADSTDLADLADSVDSADSNFNPHLDCLGYFKAAWVIIIVIVGGLFLFNREVTVKISI